MERLPLEIHEYIAHKDIEVLLTLLNVCKYFYIYLNDHFYRQMIREKYPKNKILNSTYKETYTIIRDCEYMLKNPPVNVPVREQIRYYTDTYVVPHIGDIVKFCCYPNNIYLIVIGVSIDKKRKHKLKIKGIKLSSTNVKSVDKTNPRVLFRMVIRNETEYVQMSYSKRNDLIIVPECITYKLYGRCTIPHYYICDKNILL